MKQKAGRGLLYERLKQLSPDEKGTFFRPWEGREQRPNGDNEKKKSAIISFGITNLFLIFPVLSIFLVLGVESKSLHVLGKYFATHLHS